jgi:hypothetical protein
VRIDFGARKGHRMPYAAARRTLTPIAEDDLRLMRSSNPAKLAKLRAEDPVAVLARALGVAGAGARTHRGSRCSWWARPGAGGRMERLLAQARAEAAKDPRIDASRSLRAAFPAGVSRPGAAGAEEEVPLPALEPRKPAKTQSRHAAQVPAPAPGAETAGSRGASAHDRALRAGRGG